MCDTGQLWECIVTKWIRGKWAVQESVHPVRLAGCRMAVRPVGEGAMIEALMWKLWCRWRGHFHPPGWLPQKVAWKGAVEGAPSIYLGKRINRPWHVLQYVITCLNSTGTHSKAQELLCWHCTVNSKCWTLLYIQTKGSTLTFTLDWKRNSLWAVNSINVHFRLNDSDKPGGSKQRAAVGHLPTFDYWSSANSKRRPPNTCGTDCIHWICIIGFKSFKSCQF